MMYIWNGYTVIGKHKDLTEGMLKTLDEAQEKLERSQSMKRNHFTDWRDWRDLFYLYNNIFCYISMWKNSAVMIEFERCRQPLYLVLAVVSGLDSPVVFVREWVFYRWSVSAEPLEGTVSQTPGASRGGRALLHPCALQVSALMCTDFRLCAHTQPSCTEKWCTVKKDHFWHWRHLHPHCNRCVLTSISVRRRSNTTTTWFQMRCWSMGCCVWSKAEEMKLSNS